MEALSPQQILFIHYRLIQSTGGCHGVRDIGALQAAVARPIATLDGKDLYPDPFAKAAALMESLIKNHPFLDGNKRTAITSASLFLRRCGYSLESSQDDLYDFTMSMATGTADLRDAEDWFRSHSSLV